MSDIAAHEAARWGRWRHFWLACLLVSGVALLACAAIAMGERGSVMGQWLAKGLLLHSRWCYRPPSYRVAILDDGSYVLFEEYEGEFWDFVEEKLALEETIIEVNVIVFERVSGTGWWGLTSELQPVRIWWDAWRGGESVPPDRCLYERIRVDIIESMCQWNPSACNRYRQTVASGQMSILSTPGRSTYEELFVLERILLTGYLHNLLTIIALIVLPVSAKRALAANGQCGRWRRMVREMSCPHCRYDLRGLPQPRCPECGLAFSAPALTASVAAKQIKHS